MSVVSYCGGLSQSGARWSPYVEIHFESVDQLKCVLILGSSRFTKHRFSRESLGRMFSSVHLHPTSSGARLAFRRQTSCGFCLCFQGGNHEFDKTVCWCDRRRKAFGNDYNPSQQLWLDAGENRSHSLCTISVNVDCRDEFVAMLWSTCNEWIIELSDLWS